MNYESLRAYATPRQIELLDAIKKTGGLRAAAKALGIGPRNMFYLLTRLKKAAAKQGYAPENDMTKPVPEGFTVKGVSTLYNADGQVTAQWVKSRQSDEDLRQALEAFALRLSDDVRGQSGTQKSPKVSDSSLLSAYVVGDAHIGAYAHGKETGGEDFDTSIATADLRGAFNHLVRSAPDSEVGLLVNVGDFFHANDTTSQTPASKNLLDTDGRFSQVIDRAVTVFRYAVNLMLAKHRQVWIINARGNHDPDAAIWLNKIIAAYYEREKRLTVFDNTAKFQYVEWGQVLIGVHHGDRVKRQQLYEAMTRDRREAWGRAKFSYFWTGHVHHHSAEEIGGCLFETFNTLAAPDAWHAGMGYGANREMQQITLHRDYGIVGRNICALEMARLAA